VNTAGLSEGHARVVALMNDSIARLEATEYRSGIRADQVQSIVDMVTKPNELHKMLTGA
jgi:hypothetical protein